MEYTVRKYYNDDYEQVLKIWEATNMGGAHRGDDQNAIKNTLKFGGELLVLEDNQTGNIIGTSWITNDGRRLYLHHFGIDPVFQSKGLSHLLLKHSLLFAKEKNMQIKLEVHENNIIARKLYESYGFKYLGDYDVLIIRDIQTLKNIFD